LTTPRIYDIVFIEREINKVSKLHLKRWWSKRVDYSWSEIARKEFEFCGGKAPTHRTKIIRERIAKRIYRENKKKHRLDNPEDM
jgi:hypothetical protein